MEQHVALAGRRALITGGGRGIGRAIALMLGAAGADVAVTYVRDEVAAVETVAALEKLGRTGRAYRASIASADETDAAVAAAVADLGGLDLVVSNAGIASRGRSVVDTDPAELEKVLRVHALGPHRLAQVTLPHLRQASRSDLVFVSSIAAHTTPPGGAPYTMGKAAVEALARTLAREEAGFGVHVNIVAPGLVDTEMGFRLARATAGASDIREMDERSPYGHVCSADEVAEAVLFLVSAGYVNGHRLVVDGGI